MLVLEPIFEADLQPEQYAYRPERSANDAVNRVHGLLNMGHNEVVDCDLSNYFGEIPHAELMKSVARRVSDGRMLALIKAWLEMPVEEDDGQGGKCCQTTTMMPTSDNYHAAHFSGRFGRRFFRFPVGWRSVAGRSHYSRMKFAVPVP